MAINKPSGLAVHPDGRTTEDTLVDWVLREHPEMKDVGDPERPGIVHRIDRETSGVLLLAKTEKAFEHLKAQFKNREMHKEYMAFVYGELNESFGTIDRPIGKNKNDFRRWSADGNTRGEEREAITYFEVLARGEGVTLIKAMPKTGRTHQIRVHFRVIHHPVVADNLYAANKPKLLGFERTALHARSIEFKDMEGKMVKVEAPYPEDFQKAMEEISK